MKNLFKDKHLIIFLILFLGFALRVSNVSSLPALNADEAALGYNAYSLIQTGKDEHGNAWPIHFQSFNDFKPGLYVYMLIPFIATLGLTELAVRLPSLILGTATIYLVYLLAERFMKDERYQLLSALLVAISPWHIHFSRGGWEVNVATFFITLGVLFFVNARQNQKLYYFSLVSFGLSVWTYHAARVVVPLLLLGLVYLHKKYLFGRKLGYSLFPFVSKSFVGAIIVFGLIISPVIYDLVSSPGGVSRASGVGLLADEGPFWKANEQRGEHGQKTQIFGKVLHNRPVNYTLVFLENWSSHFMGEFLFLSGDEIQRNKVPEFGQTYLFSLPFLLAGLYFAIKNSSKFAFILFWLLISPVPAALTFQSPHALRSQNMVIPLTMLIAYGIIVFVDGVRSMAKTPLFELVVLILTLGITWDLTRYLHAYYSHMAKEYNSSSQYAVKELVEYTQGKQQFSNVVVTDKYDQPYILFLFYLKYPPRDFQKDHVITPRDQYGFSTVRSFGRYRFYSVNWDTMRDMSDTLLVGAPEEINDIDANIVERIYFPSGDVAFEIVPL